MEVKPTQEQHEAFANGLALVLPSDFYSTIVLQEARAGVYYRIGVGDANYSWPIYLTSEFHYAHLLPAVKELWSAVYGQPIK